ncbi:MAG: hypothetical protein WD314_00910 [Trueperaceae bacterium]
MKRLVLWVIALICLAAAAVVAIDYVTVGKPVADELATDPRNDGIDLRARHQYRLNPRTLVLDLKDIDSAAPVDLLRAVFQSAEVFSDKGREFEYVILAERGAPVFLVLGADYREMGSQWSYGENPVFMIRKFPSKLHHPDGTPAYGEWTGGLLGVLGREMEDVNEAVQAWVSGGRS